MSKTSSRLKNLLSAISHWLNFEKVCLKENLFNEKYLSYPIGQFLKSRYTTGLRTEYLHPFISPKKVGSRAKVDFIIKEKIKSEERIVIAIETKWISDSNTLLKDCLKDVLRLSLIADSSINISCYFILCGKYSDWLTKIENNKKFSYTRNDGKKVMLFNLGVPGHNNIRPHNPPKAFTKIVEAAKSEINPINGFPDAIRMTFYGKYPKEPRKDEYIAIGWKIKTYS